MATDRPVTGRSVAADIITYRLGSKLVYVRPADDYQQALDYAQKEFPEELANMPRDHISFHINAKMNGEPQSVRISESAWVAAVTRLLRGEVIDIVARPSSSSFDTKELPPPQYLDVPHTSHSASSQLSRNRSAPSLTPSEKVSRSWFTRI